MDWNAEAIERLKLLWTEGLSTAEIGRRLSISKNAVVGKAHRLALVARPSPIRRDPNAVPRPRQPAPRRQGSTLPPLPSAAEARPAELRPAADDTASPPHQAAPGTTPHGEAPPAPIAAPEAMPAAAQAYAADAPAYAESAPLEASAEPAEEVTDGDAEPPAADMPAALISLMARGAVTRLAARPAPVQQRLNPRITACCWPIGEPGTASFHFCGKASATGRPYCEGHSEIAYVRVRDRRDNAA